MSAGARSAKPIAAARHRLRMHDEVSSLMTLREPDMADAEIGPAVGLTLPWWIEDWNHRSWEQVGGPLGYATIGVSYFARFGHVRANLPAKRRPHWQVIHRSDIGMVAPVAEGDLDEYIVLSDVVRTTFPGPSSRTDLRDALARHIRDVLVNSYGEEEHLVERHLLRLHEQLRPSSVVVNETRKEGWRTDELPHVTAAGAVADQSRLVTVVLDRTIASSLNLELVDYPGSPN